MKQVLNPWREQGRCPARTVGLLLLAAAAWLSAAPEASAQDLRVEIVNGYNLIVDSNVTSPPTYAPQAAYIGANFCNTGATTLTNVMAHTGNYDAGRSLTVGTTSGSRTVTGSFVASDGGLRISGTGIPTGAYITAVGPTAGEATISAAATATGSITASLSSAPGIFPVWTAPVTDTTHPQLSNTGSYSLTLQAGQTGVPDGTRYIGSLAPGECRIEYWLFSYPQCVNVNGAPEAPPCTASITGDVKPTDDLTLDYDLWVTADSQATVTQTRSFTMRNEISAAANKIWPNNAAKVPDEYLSAIQAVVGWGTLGPDGQPLTSSNPVYPGQRVITTQGIWYDLGNVGQGFDNNGDLVPDQNAWLQPVGDAGKFDADCFRMVNVYGIVIVKLKTGGELLIPFQNQLYFENIPDNTGVVGLVFYQFIATDQGCAAAMTPYQEAASGFDNEKFSADYGLDNPLYSGSFGANLSFTKTKAGSPLVIGNSYLYTLSVPTNTTGVNLGAPDLGTPLVFRERIPAGMTYVAGSASTANTTPPSGTGSYTQGYTDTSGNLDSCTINYEIPVASPSYYTILYSTDNGFNWSTTDPGSAVTDIQWLLFTTINLDGGHDGNDCVAPNGSYDNGTIQTSLPPGKTTSMTFQLTVGASVGPVLCNTATLGFGPATSSKSAQNCDIVTGPNSLSGTVFEDDGGVGGTYGNSTIDNATEVGIGAGVAVKLYYDVDGNGKYSTGDLQYGATVSTALAGTYSFTSLPDGLYVVVVNKYDGTDDDNAATEFSAGRVANADNTVGWGNTTYDPNLPLTTDSGKLSMSEDLNTVSLAVSIDLDHSNAADQSVTTTELTQVNFGFAPPFRLTKAVVGNPDVTTPTDVADTTLDEGQQFTYAITLQNRLPSVGRQTPTGCEYVAWGTTGTTSTQANKQFTNPGNAYDSTSPNGSVATATVANGSLRWIFGTTFALAPRPGNITKVEALYFAYFNVALTDDFLNLKVGLSTTPSDAGGLQTPVSTTTIPTAQIDSYVGAPADYDPNNAIPWNITSARPGGGSWAWSDFPGMKIQVNPDKSASADFKTFSIDAFGIRVTTDAACEASSSTTLDPVPLQDRYDTGSIEFVSADPAPTSVDTANGVIQWTDVGPLLPGASTTVFVTARTKDVTGLQTGSCDAAFAGGTTPPPATQPWTGTSSQNCNYAQTAYSTYNVKYADGRLANDDYDKMGITIQGKAELRGIVYNDVSPDDFDTGMTLQNGNLPLANVTVTLYACTKADGTLETTAGNKTCAAQTQNNYWGKVRTAVTDANGAYEFLGLNTGTYIVEVGDTDSAPATGNTAPYGGTQSAEGLDTQTVTGLNANGQVCGTCNNTWGNPTANLNTMNQLSQATEETIEGVNFGYKTLQASLYGNVWHDIDGDTAKDTGELGLSGFSVALYRDTNSSGVFDSGDTQFGSAATTDSNGNYAFSNITPTAVTYFIVVTPPILRTQAWVETSETGPGSGLATCPWPRTGSCALNNQIYLTVGSGAVSGSHDFGYTKGDTASIGDTVFLDTNGNGFQDSTESGIPNITVSLYLDVDRDGTIDTGVDDLVGTTSTDASGNYLFSNLAAGSYIVQVDRSDTDFPANLTTTTDPDVSTGRIGDLVYFDADANSAPSRSFACTIASGGTTTSAGSFLPSDVGAPISGTGIPAGTIITAYTSASVVTISAATTQAVSSCTVSDAGIPNVVVALYEDTNASGSLEVGTSCTAPCDKLVAATTTDVNGNYLFTGLHAGSYFVDVADSANTAVEENGNTLPSSTLALVGTDPRTVLIALGSNDSSVLTADAGYSPSGSGSGAFYAMGGVVWEDANGNGVRGSGEAGLPGVRVKVWTATVGDACYSADSGATGGCTATTDAAGAWIVPGLTNTRSYTATVQTTSLPRSHTPTTPPGTPTNAKTIASMPTQDWMTANFGYRFNTDGNLTTRDTGDPTGTINGRVFLDQDGDQAYDTGEARSGTTVNLIDENGYVIATTTTDSTGQYYFGGTSTCNLGTSPACSGITVGQYSVQAVDTLGTRYSTVFVSASSSFPNLNVIYTASIETTPDSLSSVGVDGIHADLMQDFGYRQLLGAIGDTVYWDANRNGTQDLSEPGVAGVTVSLYSCGWTDSNSNSYFEIGEQTVCNLASPLATTVTAADDPLTPAYEGGTYLFTNLSTVGRSIAATTTVGSTTVTSNGLFTADDVGDPISGPGIPAGATITAFASTSSVTISDYATASAATRVYIGNYYLVRVDTGSTPLSGATLTADPDTDGAPCAGFTPAGACDSAQLAVAFRVGVNYLGADFGYDLALSASNGYIGDLLWVDQDGDGSFDDGERGIPSVRVYIDTGAAGFDWTDANGNGRWDSGEGDRWTVTDAEGNYLFTGLTDATYVVKVNTGDATYPLPSGLTATYEAGQATIDNSVSVTLTGGVAAIAASSCASDCNLAVDFGYRYPGTNTLSGTICVDDSSKNGYCGASATGIVVGTTATSTTVTSAGLFQSTDVGRSISGDGIPAGATITAFVDANTVTISAAATATGSPTVTLGGVGTGESALGGIQVSLYRWTDDGDNTAWDGTTGVLDSGDAFVLLGATTTSSHGDYSFGNVPANVIVVFGVPASQNLALTTTQANTSEEGATSRQLYNGTTLYQENTVTVLARQALSGLGTSTRDVDFGFDATLNGALSYDFGDLPSNYRTLLQDGGAQQLIGGSLYLGSGVTSETDGKPDANATGETDTAADGVTLDSYALTAGADGGSVTVTASGAGWLAGWFDFNQDGDFADEGERIINQAVAGAGTQTIPFEVPGELLGLNSVGDVFNGTLFARFRIYPSQPLLISSAGLALDSTFQPAAGEVEDYAFTVSVTQAVVSSFVARERRGDVAIEWDTSSEIGTVGFFLRRYDEDRKEYVQVNERLLPSLMRTRQGGHYSYVDPGAQRGVTHYYELVEVEASGKTNVYGPYTVNTTATLQADQSRPGPEKFVPEPDASGFAKAEHARRPARTRRPALLAGNAPRRPRAQGAKLAVAESGLHYVSLADLESAGLRIDKTWLLSSKNLYSLENRGKPVAFAAAWDLSGIYFYGQALDSPYAKDNIYRIGESTRNAPRMMSRKERPARPASGAETFTRSLHVEQDAWPATGVFRDAESDYWVWDFVIAGWGPTTLPFEVSGATGSGEATLTVRLKGASSTPFNPDHHAVLTLNGQQVGDVSWDGTAAIEHTLTFDARLLVEGNNSLEISGEENPAGWSFFLIDSFDVQYQSLYRAAGNRLDFPAAGNPAIFASGFTSPDVMVFDVTDPNLPVHVEAPVSRTADGLYGISLAPPKPNVVYHAVAPDAVRIVGRVTPDAASSLRSPDNRAEHLIITTSELAGTAQALADHRSDLRSQVIDVEDIYDEFNYGIPSPHAIKAFLAYARASWNVPPRFAVLAGDGSIDYKDIMGMGGNLIPTMMVGTAHGLFVSDTWFGDVDPAKPAAEIAIGRLPVSTPEELERVIRKIQAREGASGAPWLSRVLLAADNGDRAGDFAASSERIASLLPPGSEAQRIYLSTLGIDETRAQLINGISEGAGMVNYVGHGGYDILADEGILWNDDVAGLANYDRPTVLTALTCLIGDFSTPGYPSLGELLVQQESAGAAAVWAPTGLSINEHAIALAEGFYAAASGGRTRIGDAITATTKDFEKARRPAYMLSIYALLGDPAMWLQ